MELYKVEPEARRRRNQLFWFAAWAGATGIGLWLKQDPHGHGTHQQLGLMPCPSVILFDRPCPGCGLTTSWTALLHGDVGFAFRAHPLGPILYLAFTISAWLSLYGWRKGVLLNTDSRGFNRGFAVGLAIFVGFGLTRMAMTPHFATQSERYLSSIARQIQAQP